MKITKKRFLLIFTSLILSFSLLAGCHSADTVRNNQQNTVDSASSENENFREFTDAIFRDNVSGDILSLHTILQHPENYGITNYEKTLGRYNLDNPTDSSDISDCLTQLNSFDKNSLSKDQQITYELLKKYLQTKLEYCDLFLLDTDLSTTIGIQVQLPIIFAEYILTNIFVLSKIRTNFLKILSNMKKCEAKRAILWKPPSQKKSLSSAIHL